MIPVPFTKQDLMGSYEYITGERYKHKEQFSWRQTRDVLDNVSARD